MRRVDVHIRRKRLVRRKGKRRWLGFGCGIWNVCVLGMVRTKKRGEMGEGEKERGKLT